MDRVPFCQHDLFLLSCDECCPTDVLSFLLSGSDEEHDFWPYVPQAADDDSGDDDTPRCPCCDRNLGDPDCTCTRCEDCKGSGWYEGLGVREHCKTCEGAGWL